jgi:AcrR family transcriptional regulator
MDRKQVTQPHTQRGATTRSRIIEAACVLVRVHGAAATSIDAVISAAEVSKSQLYHYFADKETLITAVVEHQTAQVLAFNGALLSEFASVVDLQRWSKVLIDGPASGNQGCPLGSLVGELANRPTQRAMLAKGFTQWRAIFADGFVRMRNLSQLRDTIDPEDLAIMCLAALQGGLLLAQAEQSTRPLRLALEMAIAQVAANAP